MCGCAPKSYNVIDFSTISVCGCAPKSYNLIGVPDCKESEMACWRTTMEKVKVFAELVDFVTYISKIRVDKNLFLFSNLGNFISTLINLQNLKNYIKVAYY